MVSQEWVDGKKSCAGNNGVPPRARTHSGPLQASGSRGEGERRVTEGHKSEPSREEVSTHVVRLGPLLLQGLL